MPRTLKLAFASLTLVVFCLGSAAVSRADTITFESVPGVTPGPIGGPAAPPTRLSNQLSNQGVVFSSGSGVGYVSLVFLGAGHATSGTNGISGVDSSGNIDFSSIVVNFVNPSNPSAAAVTNFVSIRADNFGAGGTITLQAFGIGGDLLGSNTQTDSDGPLLSLSLSGINSIRVLTNSFGTTFDDLTFNTPTAITQPPSSPVPEPTTLALLGTGLAGVAARVRRRRTAAGENS